MKHRVQIFVLTFPMSFLEQLKCCGDVTSGQCSCDCPRRRSWSDRVVCHNLIDVFYKNASLHTP